MAFVASSLRAGFEGATEMMGIGARATAESAATGGRAVTSDALARVAAQESGVMASNSVREAAEAAKAATQGRGIAYRDAALETSTIAKG